MFKYLRPGHLLSEMVAKYGDICTSEMQHDGHTYIVTCDMNMTGGKKMYADWLQLFPDVWNRPFFRNLSSAENQHSLGQTEEIHDPKARVFQEDGAVAAVQLLRNTSSLLRALH